MFDFIFGRTIKVRPPIFTYKEVSEKLKNTLALSTVEAVLMGLSNITDPLEGKALRFKYKAKTEWQEVIFVRVTEERYPKDHQDYKEVIMMHELGHLMYQHNQERTGRLLKNELEADWFAVKACGKSKVLRALIALQAMRDIDHDEMKARIAFIKDLEV